MIRLIPSAYKKLGIHPHSEIKIENGIVTKPKKYKGWEALFFFYFSTPRLHIRDPNPYPKHFSRRMFTLKMKLDQPRRNVRYYINQLVKNGVVPRNRILTNTDVINQMKPNRHPMTHEEVLIRHGQTM